MTNAKSPKPKFDFSCAPRDWSQTFFKTAHKAAKAQVALERPLHPDSTADQIQAYYDAKDAALDTIAGISDEQLDLVRQVLKAVPDEWLIPGAPADLDWSEVASYSWIQDDRYTEILQMIQSGEARKQAKN